MKELDRKNLPVKIRWFESKKEISKAYQNYLRFDILDKNSKFFVTNITQHSITQNNIDKKLSPIIMKCSVIVIFKVVYAVRKGVKYVANVYS